MASAGGRQDHQPLLAATGQSASAGSGMRRDRRERPGGCGRERDTHCANSSARTLTWTGLAVDRSGRELARRGLNSAERTCGRSVRAWPACLRRTLALAALFGSWPVPASWPGEVRCSPCSLPTARARRRWHGSWRLCDPPRCTPVMNRRPRHTRRSPFTRSCARRSRRVSTGAGPDAD